MSLRRGSQDVSVGRASAQQKITFTSEAQASKAGQIGALRHRSCPRSSIMNACFNDKPVEWARFMEKFDAPVLSCEGLGVPSCRLQWRQARYNFCRLLRMKLPCAYKVGCELLFGRHTDCWACRRVVLS